jgi:hypothetical protein
MYSFERAVLIYRRGTSVQPFVLGACRYLSGAQFDA